MKHSKLFKPIFLAALLVSVMTASAEDFIVNGFCYSINKDGTSVTLTLCGGLSSTYWGLTEVDIPSTVTIGSKTYSVTSIGNAFYDCSSLTSVTIPNSVTSIGQDAFSGCTSLTSITIPNSVTSIGHYAFSGCTSLTSITIPNSVTSIGAYAFYRTPWLNNQPDGLVYAGLVAYTYKGTMTNNTSTNIKNGTLSISPYCFQRCSGLTSVTIPNSVTSIGQDAFSGCTSLTSITIPNSVTTIGYDAFRDCSSLTSVTIPNSVNSIGKEAFHGTAIWNNSPNGVFYVNDWVCGYKGDKPSGHLELSEKARGICGNAFEYCSLTSVSIKPGSVKSIGEGAFSGCSGLTSITIPNSVTSIGGGAFSGCSGLESIVVDSDNNKYDSRNNCNAIIEKASNTLIKGCKNTIIPNSVTSIGGSAFRDCSGLTSVAIPNSITSIGDSAFYYCTGLTSITIPNSVTSIGNEAFYKCTSLTSITIPNSVTSIGGFAFSGCRGMTSVTIPNSVTTIAGSAFSYCSSLTSIIIPNSVTSIGNNAFSGCSGLTSVTIPKSVSSIGAYAFEGCRDLTSITIPNSVTSIGYDAFGGCWALANVHITNLAAWFNIYFFDIYSNPLYYATHLYLNENEIKDLVVPNTVTSIGEYAFYKCSSFNTIVLGEKVKEIGDNAFAGANNLKSITCKRFRPAAIQENTFSDNAYSNATLRVPKGSLSLYYVTTGWMKFDNIVEDDEEVIPGDANGDGKVNVSDVTALINMILGVIPKDEARADINGDGIINVSDVTALVNIILGVV